MTYYSHIIQATLYDGANYTEMTEAASAYYAHTNYTTPVAFVSAYPGLGDLFTIQTDQYSFNLEPGQWLVQDKDVVYATNNTPHFEAFYRLPDLLTPTLAVGYAVTPSLGIGASATVSVDMVPALPDAGYNVAVALAGSAQLLGALAILSATVAGSAQVDVVVQNNGLLTLAGATVLVTALHNG